MQVADACRPIGIFWDIENCRVPKNKSATDLVLKIRNNVVKRHQCREFEFFCGCDTSTLQKHVCEELNRAGVTVAHVPSSSKNAADEKLKEQMTKFVDTHGSKATVVLISGDINFAPTLRGFRDRIGVRVILIHSNAVAHELKNCADFVHSFPEICEDLQLRQYPIDDAIHLVQINGLPTDMAPQSIRRELQISTQNRGGKVAHVAQGSAFVAFPCQRDAERAIGGIDGNKIGNSVVSAKIASVIPKKDRAQNGQNKSQHGSPPKYLNVASLPMNQMHCIQPVQQNALFGVFPGLDTKQKSFGNMNAAAPQANGKAKTFRLVVSGFSGNLSDNSVRLFLWTKLLKKPASISITNGSADMVFLNQAMLDEAYANLNGVVFNGFPLIAHKVYKPKNNGEELGSLLGGLNIENSFSSNGHNVNAAMKEKVKIFRLIVSGIPGAMKEEEVKEVLWNQLSKKPKSIIVANGSADMEFSSYEALDSAFLKFNGIILSGYPLTAHKASKPRAKAEAEPVKESLHQKWSTLQEIWKKNEKGALNVTFTNKANLSSKSSSVTSKSTVEMQNKPAETKGRFMWIKNLPLVEEPQNISTKLHILARANNGNVIEISGQEAWVEFPNHVIAEEAKKIFQTSGLAPSLGLDILTTNYVPAKIYEARKKLKEAKAMEKKAKVLSSPEASKKKTANSANSKEDENKPTYLSVSGLSSKLPTEEVKEALSDLFKAFDGVNAKQ
ncbi:meiosis arrest female protein 1-like protein [Leptotrombidium deliense]|uniref:Meiosis regulator and mRNA stability factor 1 n=1 Tax=Leptotrombidium deliense TaxID=299467 RepID=A0A443SNV5_9ACAR|nr:meiosis arrest female protein 1-like protein [Leptotrombidium deliense]